MSILEQLKKKGYRLTNQRKEILSVLTDYPLTAEELRTSLQKKGFSMDLASVYRNLELLDTMGFVHWSDLGGGKKRYERIDKSNHHHHIVCKNCGAIEDVVFPENFITEKAEKQTTFRIDHHHLEFFGLCKKCQ